MQPAGAVADVALATQLTQALSRTGALPLVSQTVAANILASGSNRLDVIRASGAPLPVQVANTEAESQVATLEAHQRAWEAERLGHSAGSRRRGYRPRRAATRGGLLRVRL